MTNLITISGRNLFRYKRRTFLTLALIAIGVLFVAGFVAVTGSFKSLMIGQITDSFVGHIQIHRIGYLSNIDTMPLTMNMKSGAIRKVEEVLKETPGIEAYSPRIKFGGMFSNFTETTNIRLNGIDPGMETKTVPLLLTRILDGNGELKIGEIFVPELIAKGMKIRVGDTVVVVATNKDGSVNGKQLEVGGIMESATGPGGRDGYVHIEDAREILRMEDQEISEFAIRVKNFGALDQAFETLDERLSGEMNKQEKPAVEVHTWEKLSPFYNIARMIDMMTLFVKTMLIAIVMISIMNVMIMAVYERVREIGTIAAIGTLPGKILSMFLIEGLLLGAIGAAIGSVISLVMIYVINLLEVTYNFGRQKDIVLSASLNPQDHLVISGIVIVVAVIASLQPAFKASKMDPIQALGYV